MKISPQRKLLAQQLKASVDQFSEVLARPLMSGLMRLDENWNIHITRSYSKAGAGEAYILPSINFRLPPSPFAPAGCKLAERIDLIKLFALAVDQALYRNKGSLGRIGVIQTISHTLAKTFEYGFLNGIYRISDWHRDDFDDLAQKLVDVGWYGALNIDARCADFVNALPVEKWADVWRIRVYSARTEVSLYARVCEDIGTNIRHWELWRARARLAELMKVALPVLEPLDIKPKYAAARKVASVMSDLRAINLLGIEDAGVGFLPYPKTNILARGLGAPASQRTPSIDPCDLAKLLKHANWCIETLAPLALECLKNCFQVAKNPAT